MDNTVIGLCTRLGGIRILGLEHGIDDYIICKTSDNKTHKVKVYYSGSGKGYFYLKGFRILLEECFRIGTGWG